MDLQKLWYERRVESAPWFASNASSIYNYAQLHLAQSFVNYFAGRTRVPTFKFKGRSESSTLTGGSTRLVDSHHVRLSRIGDVKTYESMRKFYRHLERGSARIVSASVIERRGKYTLAFTAEMNRVIPAPRPPEWVVGIDVGLTTLYTGATPDGAQVLSVANPRHYQRHQARLARAQRMASRRRGPRKGGTPSNRWRRANQRAQNVHADITNARKDLIHETTTMLAKSYDRIVVEGISTSRAC